MKKLSQYNPGSNPATSDAVGATNMPLNSSAGSTEESGITPSELKDFLNKMIRYGDEDKDNLATELGQIRDKVKDPDIKAKLDVLGNALMMNSDKQKLSKDPDTDERMPGPDKLAKDIIALIDNISNRSSKAVYNNKLAQTKIEKKKKKTRGNPFRVLMGKVGKLLDHGVEKKDIVRYLAKLKYWNNETIERAVDIVRDYNRKKERKDREDEPVENTEKKSSNNSKVITSALDYDRKPDFTKKSTGELIYRACFLMDLLETDKFTKQGDFKDPTDKKGAKEELKSVKNALIERGLDKEELSSLGLGE